LNQTGDEEGFDADEDEQDCLKALPFWGSGSQCGSRINGQKGWLVTEFEQGISPGLQWNRPEELSRIADHVTVCCNILLKVAILV
jgi:hypothetical protein